MTDEEMDKVLEVISNADGGCRECVSELFSLLMKSLPENDWKVRAYFSSNYHIGKAREDYIRRNG